MQFQRIIIYMIADTSARTVENFPRIIFYTVTFQSHNTSKTAALRRHLVSTDGSLQTALKGLHRPVSCGCGVYCVAEVDVLGLKGGKIMFDVSINPDRQRSLQSMALDLK